MPKNLEIKVKLNSHKRMIEILKENKINLKEVLYQKDIYYKTKSGILKLRIENNIHTLIFYNRNEKSPKRWSDFHLLEFDNQNPHKFFVRIWEPLVVVEKKRQLYLYKNTRIHLDAVKNLGLFLELEAKVVKGLKDAELRFNYLLNLLDLKSKKEIRASYKDLLLSKGK